MIHAKNQIETEVKYLIEWNDKLKNKVNCELKRRSQFYVNAGEYTIRISYRNKKFLFTMKLPIYNSISQYEIETEITEDVAREFFKKADRVVVKDHGVIKSNEMDFEVEINVFERTKNNIMEGYALVEVEMNNEDEETLEMVNDVITKLFEGGSITNVTKNNEYANSNMAVSSDEVTFEYLKGRD